MEDDGGSVLVSNVDQELKEAQGKVGTEIHRISVYFLWETGAKYYFAILFEDD